MQQPIDQPLPPFPEPKNGSPSELPLLLRYGITVVLFPAALLRLRSGTIDAWTLIKGGLLSSTQFLIAAILFVVFRLLWKKAKAPKPQALLLQILRVATDLIVLLGVLQLLYQFF